MTAAQFYHLQMRMTLLHLHNQTTGYKRNDKFMRWMWRICNAINAAGASDDWNQFLLDQRN